MSPRIRTALPLALVAAAFAAGCGGGDEEQGEPIPAARAEALIEQLEQIERQADAGACSGARAKLDELEQKVEALPADTDQDVVQALDDGVSHLRELVNEECEANRPDRTDTTETETDTQPEEPEPTEPEPSEPEPTEPEPQPEPEEPQPEEPQPEEPQEPPTGNGDGGGTGGGGQTAPQAGEDGGAGPGTRQRVLRGRKG